jgi:hypothetical protein
MRRGCSKIKSPDLFSPAAASASTPVTRGNSPTEPVLLPRDLEGSLARLSETDFERLRGAITKEAVRRGGPGQLAQPPEQARARAERATRPETLANVKAHEGRAGGAAVTAGKGNAIRAAFKAGLKLPTIARQFGVSQATVRQVLQAKKKS